MFAISKILAMGQKSNITKMPKNAKNAKKMLLKTKIELFFSY